MRIQFNFLSDPADLIALQQACRRGLEIARQKPLDQFRGKQIAPAADAESTAGLEALIRAAAITGDRRKFGGVRARAVFSRLLSDQGWTRGLDCEAGASRG